MASGTENKGEPWVFTGDEALVSNGHDSWEVKFGSPIEVPFWFLVEVTPLMPY
jgi:hypothetical protein